MLTRIRLRGTLIPDIPAPGGIAHAPVADVRKYHDKAYSANPWPAIAALCKSGRGWSNPHCPRPRDAVSPLSLSRSRPISGGAVSVTVAAVEARHTHSIFHLMCDGDGRLLFACHGGQQHGRGVHLMTAALPSSSSASFERRGARYRSRYEQSSAIQISRRSLRNSRDLYRRPLQYMRRFTSTAPARGARALNRAISNSCL